MGSERGVGESPWRLAVFPERRGWMGARVVGTLWGLKNFNGSQRIEMLMSPFRSISLTSKKKAFFEKRPGHRLGRFFVGISVFFWDFWYIFCFYA